MGSRMGRVGRAARLACRPWHCPLSYDALCRAMPSIDTIPNLLGKSELRRRLSGAAKSTTTIGHVEASYFLVV